MKDDPKCQWSIQNPPLLLCTISLILVSNYSFHPVTSACDFDDFRCGQKTIKIGRSRWYITKQLTQFLKKPIPSYDCGFILMPAHDEFKEVFRRRLWQGIFPYYR
jgi:hypothetical protein